ncbi:hypothetical protein GA0115240_14065 [Streptomyces sp. DvalAA-14]|uniref:hypothetical protein n=1 Tax=unclassified Streptomyces TaxID=2593676 RepID=UPI00081B29A2|nr:MULTISPECIES: hypothetical protein [unclassified Streptomyces]MYS22328.1 hypothetical protein [Streptomyces sp. SID4948]SCE14077.1 hypothetical protein GA0115240_14065 [Streptomyces sp. DvalAA-14]
MTALIMMAAADGPPATAGTELAGFLICCATGAAVITYGRMQRRSGRNMFLPDRPFRFGGVLHQPPPERRTRRAVGRFFEIVGWILVVIGIINGLVLL